MKTNHKLIFLISILYFLPLTGQLAFAQSSEEIKIIESTNLRKILNQTTKQEKVIILYVSSPTCPHCKKLEADILMPMLKSGDYRNKSLLRKFVIDSDKQIVNFNDRRQNPKSLMDEYGVKATPTLLFLDKNGKQLNEAIIGYSNDEFYWHYLDNAIKKSNQQLRELDVGSNR